MSTKSRSSRSSRRRKRREVDFDVASIASSSLTGFEPTPSVAPSVTSTTQPAAPITPHGFEAWKSLPDGRYNYINGRWYEAPKPKYFWSPNNNKYEIIGGRLYAWPS